MNKIWGFIYIMSFGTPRKGRNPEEPSIPMDYGSPPKRGLTTQVHKLNDIAQINALSYRSAFGFIFLMTDTNNVKKVLKVYFLDPLAGENTEGRDFELPIKYEAMNPSKKVVEAMNPSKKVVEAMNLSKAKPFVIGFDEDDNIGYPKRVESTLNFNKEAQIQGEVYEASSSNGPLCPQIYDSYIVENNESHVFLKGLLEKCRDEDVEAKNMIQYLIKYKRRYDIGCILMEYAEGYTISTADNSENVIYANIRLLLETGYLHLDLNYGNVMVSGENVRLIDFGKSKKILDLLKNDKDIENFNNIHTISIKDVLDANDIIQLINYINYFDRIYGVYYNLFQQNFTGIKKSYKDIADKLNARQNKTIHLDLTNRINNIDNSSRTRKRSIFDSPPGTSLPKNVFRSSIFDSPQGNVLFDSSHDNNENMNPNFMYTPPKFTGYRGGTKRKYKNKSKKTRKNKSNKKRVKLISKK